MALGLGTREQVTDTISSQFIVMKEGGKHRQGTAHLTH